MKRTFEVAVEDECVLNNVIVFHEEQEIKRMKNWSPLHEMACVGNLSESTDDEFDVSPLKLVSGLILKSINEQDMNGCTPLSWAVSEGNFESAETLIECGAEVNCQNFSGETPLFLACARGYQAICQLLLESGANPNIPNSEGVYPVHMAVASGFYEIVTLLCSRGAFMNVKDDVGDSLLHYAVR